MVPLESGSETQRLMYQMCNAVSAVPLHLAAINCISLLRVFRSGAVAEQVMHAVTCQRMMMMLMM